MVAGFPPPLAHLEQVSVTEVDALLSCPLQLAYRRSGHGKRRSTPWARLGTVCHEVLERAARGELGDVDEGFDDRYTQVWDQAIGDQERLAAEGGESELYGPATSWPTYATKRARLRRRAREIAYEARSWRDRKGVRIEERLEAPGEILFGYPDLIVREPGPYRIVDYKSGVVTSPSDDEELNPGYRRQVLLYAYLESAQADGGRPIEGQVVPLTGESVRFDIDWPEVEALAAEVHAVIDATAKSVAVADLARPSADTCRFCTYAARCPAFHAALDPALELGAIALVGSVLGSWADTSGRLTMDLTVERATGIASRVKVERIDPSRYPAAALVAPGDRVCCIGLRRRGELEDELVVTSRTVIERL